MVEKEGQAYKKLRPFLRAVPLFYDSDFNNLLPDYEYHDLVEKLRWQDEDGEPGRPLRIARDGAPRWAAIIWLPNDNRFEEPTFEQFMSAYGKL